MAAGLLHQLRSVRTHSCRGMGPESQVSAANSKATDTELTRCHPRRESGWTISSAPLRVRSLPGDRQYENYRLALSNAG